jgi:hypothetical protein
MRLNNRTLESLLGEQFWESMQVSVLPNSEDTFLVGLVGK